MRLDDIIGESRENKKKALHIQKRINAVLGKIPIDCGINDTARFLHLIESIANDQKVADCLMTLIGSGAESG